MKKLKLNDNDILRFWSNIDKNGNDNCWNWLGKKAAGSNGYLFYTNIGIKVQILSWFIEYGIFPGRNNMKNICGNEKCVNPNHFHLIRAQNNRKYCCICNAEKDILNFSPDKKSKDGLRSYCKECMNDYTLTKNKTKKYRKKVKERHTQRKQILSEIKENKSCMDCGVFYPACVMDFDHIKKKYRNVSTMFKNSLDSIKKEITKCELVCSNCHRIRTYNRTHKKKIINYNINNE